MELIHHTYLEGTNTAGNHRILNLVLSPINSYVDDGIILIEDEEGVARLPRTLVSTLKPNKVAHNINTLYHRTRLGVGRVLGGRVYAPLIESIGEFDARHEPRSRKTIPTKYGLAAARVDTCDDFVPFSRETLAYNCGIVEVVPSQEAIRRLGESVCAQHKNRARSTATLEAARLGTTALFRRD